MTGSSSKRASPMSSSTTLRPSGSNSSWPRCYEVTVNSARARGILAVAALAVVVLAPTVWSKTARPAYVVTAIDYHSQDVAPGRRLVIRDIAAFLGGPGEYPFHCRFHQSLGMTGVIVIAR